MKYSGDIPKEHKALALALQDAEMEIDVIIGVPEERKAQIYTCLAHDWFDISMEEEGNRLLIKADKTCPGYFKDIVGQHMAEDPTYDYLVKKITVELLNLMLGSKT